MSSVVADDHLADDRQSMGSRTSLRPASARRRRQAKLAYFQAITEPTVVGIEEVSHSYLSSDLSPEVAFSVLADKYCIYNSIQFKSTFINNLTQREVR